MKLLELLRAFRAFGAFGNFGAFTDFGNFRAFRTFRAFKAFGAFEDFRAILRLKVLLTFSRAYVSQLPSVTAQKEKNHKQNGLNPDLL